MLYCGPVAYIMEITHYLNHKYFIPILANSVGSDWAVRMLRLIWGFAGRTLPVVGTNILFINEFYDIVLLAFTTLTVITIMLIHTCTRIRVYR